MRVCVVGSGGREHVLADVLGRTADEVVVTPGNPGIPGSVATDPQEIDADLYVIGPDPLLVDGLADRLRARGRRVFGPGADGARLEGSKRWMKELLTEVGVATASHGAFTAVDPALAFLHSLPPPWVVKTDGLAAGKGVLVTTDLTQAEADVAAKLSGASFGEAGRTVVIEEGLVGPELSVLAVCDGTTAVALAPAQDFKRLRDGDTGPNTGSMGAYSPVPVAPPELVDSVMETAVLPTLAALRRRGIDYRGVLYAGLMLTPEGPKVLEFNVRFGDPEAQVVLPRLSGDWDLAALLAEAADGRLRNTPMFSPEAAVTVVCASEGYPVSPRTGDRIEGLAAAAAVEGVTIYCAGVAAGSLSGTARGPADHAADLVTAGGRVLDVTAVAPTLAEARDRAYLAVSRLSWPGMQFRRDIALDATGPAAPTHATALHTTPAVLTPSTAADPTSLTVLTPSAVAGNPAHGVRTETRAEAEEQVDTGEQAQAGESGGS